MTHGHLIMAKELGIEITMEEAEAITAHDRLTSTCIEDGSGGYVVYKTSKSITGDIHILTKIFIPPSYRGQGKASKLLDECETPLLMGDIEGKTIRRIR